MCADPLHLHAVLFGMGELLSESLLMSSVSLNLLKINWQCDCCQQIRQDDRAKKNRLGGLFLAGSKLLPANFSGGFDVPLKSLKKQWVARHCLIRRNALSFVGVDNGFGQ